MKNFIGWVQCHPLTASFGALGIALLLGFVVALPSLTQTKPAAQSSDSVDQDVVVMLVQEVRNNGSDFVGLICESDVDTAIAVMDDDRNLASRPTYVAALAQLCHR